MNDDYFESLNLEEQRQWRKRFDPSYMDYLYEMELDRRLMLELEEKITNDTSEANRLRIK